MRVTFLGTGDAGGVPLYGCDCAACMHARGAPSFVRRPCSALVEDGGTRVLLDAGLMDLTARFPPGSLDAIVLTHFHPDHVQGLFHLRWGRGPALPVHAPPDTDGCADLYRNPGMLAFDRAAKFEPFMVGALTFTPLPLVHSKPTFGYAIEGEGGSRFAYLTDTVGLPPKTSAFLRAWHPDGLALDCSHPPPASPLAAAPRNHNDAGMALSIIADLGPRQAWLTHIGHEVDAWLLAHAPSLPRGVAVARDGMVAQVTPPA